MEVKKTDLLLWIDVATSGPHPRSDSILEIGYVLTDMDMTPFNESFSGVLPYNPIVIEQLMLNKELLSKYNKNGLLYDWMVGPDMTVMDFQVKLNNLKDRYAIFEIHPAGFSIHSAMSALEGYGFNLAFCSNIYFDIGTLALWHQSPFNADTLSHRVFENIARCVNWCREFQGKPALVLEEFSD